MNIQVVATQWITQLADLLPFGYAFGAGMVSAVNPCGFFMLPVYMTLYLGSEENDYLEQSIFSRAMKATWVAIMVTLGFSLLFGIVGAIVSAGGYYLMGIMPWFAVLVGFILVLLGIWILLGNTLSLPFMLKLVDNVGDLRQMSTKGFFIFGLAFGATSLGCTLPIFLAVVGRSFTAGNLSTGLIHLLSFILGMGMVMHMLTLGIAMVKKRFVLGMMRRVVPYIHKISALFLLGAGGYIIYYWFSSGILLGV